MDRIGGAAASVVGGGHQRRPTLVGTGDGLEPVVGGVEATVTGQRLKDLDGLGDPDGEWRGRGRIDRLDAVVVDLGREGQVARLELDALAGARHGSLDGGRQCRPSATSPGRLNTWAPSTAVRLAAIRVRATSGAYWYIVGPLNDTRYGMPSTAATIALVGPLVIPWSRPTP